MSSDLDSSSNNGSAIVDRTVEIPGASRAAVVVDTIAFPDELRRPANQAVSQSRPTKTTVSLVIPAKNEARNLATVLEHLPDCVTEVILVDGRSSDVTQLMARSCRPDIRIIGDPAPGKGHALRAGFAAARCDVVIAMDADGSMVPDEIPQFLWFLEHGFDFVKGSRFIGGGGSLDITPIRKLGNRGLLLVANLCFDVQMTDLCYGFFGFRRKYLDHLDLSSAGFEIETELTVRAVCAGLRIAEVPSLEHPRRSGRSSLRSFSDGYRVLRTLMSERSRQAGGRAPARPQPSSEPSREQPAA
jgi:glycosyltransferase involved in cell wall biosynthesis